MAKTSEGREFELIPVGTRVRHKKYLELSGTVRDHQFWGRGIYSALPYTVEWDNHQLARDLLGIIPIWPTIESIEIIPEKCLGCEHPGDCESSDGCMDPRTIEEIEKEREKRGKRVNWNK